MMTTNEIKAKLLEILIDELRHLSQDELTRLFYEDSFIGDENDDALVPMASECLKEMVANNDLVSWRYDGQRYYQATDSSFAKYREYSGVDWLHQKPEGVELYDARDKAAKVESKPLDQFIQTVRDSMRLRCDYEMGYVPAYDVQCICNVVLDVWRHIPIHDLSGEIVTTHDVMKAIKGEGK